jgi:hypothetical protein
MLVLAATTFSLAVTFAFVLHAFGAAQVPVSTKDNNVAHLSVVVPKVSVSYLPPVRFDLPVRASHHMVATVDPPLPSPCGGEKPGVCPDSPFAQSN